MKGGAASEVAEVEVRWKASSASRNAADETSQTADEAVREEDPVDESPEPDKKFLRSGSPLWSWSRLWAPLGSRLTFRRRLASSPLTASSPRGEQSRGSQAETAPSSSSSSSPKWKAGPTRPKLAKVDDDDDGDDDDDEREDDKEEAKASASNLVRRSKSRGSSKSSKSPNNSIPAAGDAWTRGRVGVGEGLGTDVGAREGSSEERLLFEFFL